MDQNEVYGIRVGRTKYVLLLSDVNTLQVTRVNLTNVQYEGLRIRRVGRQMNSKVKSVKQGVYRK
jgi:hypothetical protein